MTKINFKSPLVIFFGIVGLLGSVCVMLIALALFGPRPIQKKIFRMFYTPTNLSIAHYGNFRFKSDHGVRTKDPKVERMHGLNYSFIMGPTITQIPPPSLYIKLPDGKSYFLPELPEEVVVKFFIRKKYRKKNRAIAINVTIAPIVIPFLYSEMGK